MEPAMIFAAVYADCFFDGSLLLCDLLFRLSPVCIGCILPPQPFAASFHHCLTTTLFRLADNRKQSKAAQTQSDELKINRVKSEIADQQRRKNRPEHTP